MVFADSAWELPIIPSTTSSYHIFKSGSMIGTQGRNLSQSVPVDIDCCLRGVLSRAANSGPKRSRIAAMTRCLAMQSPRRVFSVLPGLRLVKHPGQLPRWLPAAR
jgi:hypothetical protein